MTRKRMGPPEDKALRGPTEDKALDAPLENAAPASGGPATRRIRMRAERAAEGIAGPLEEAEVAADLAAYLVFIQFADYTGDAPGVAPAEEGAA